ncbi:MAG: hypothetical protein NVSMB8_12820 [Candidatus Limnocylindrales bacterium]
MRYEVRIADALLRVEASADGRMLVDDVVVAAGVAEVVPGILWSVTIDGLAHEIALLGRDPLRLWVDGVETRAEVADERAVAAARRGGRATVARSEVRAPMPGLIKAVHVAEGAPVEAGAPLVTLEAMKMENELRAPQSGTVTKLGASVGATVDGGALLVIIAPDRPAADRPA